MSRLLCLLLFLTNSVVPVAAQQLDNDLQRAKTRYDRQPTNPDADVNRIAAEAASFFRAGKLSEAVDRYDQAAAAAFRLGATGRSFEFSLVAAEIERKQGNYLSATDRFERAALANSNDPRAVTTHFAACQALSSHLKNGSSEGLARLDQMLIDHRQMWPNAPTASKATWQRIELLAGCKKWDDLLKAVKAVKADNPRFDRALALLVLAHQGRYALKLREQGLSQESIEVLTMMTQDLESIILGKERRWPRYWNTLQLQATEALARAHLSRGKVGAEYSLQLLSIAIKGTASSKLPIRDALIVTGTVAAITSEKYQEADALLLQFVAMESERRALLQSTRDRLAIVSADEWSQEADRLLRTIQALQGSSNTSSNELVQVDALISAGRREEALRLLNDLIAANPKNANFPIARAKLLSKGTQIAEQELALRSWHEIEARSAQSTEAWFQARLERLRLLVELDRKKEAAKLLKLTKLLAPTLGGESMSQAFELLDSQLSE